MDETRLKTTYEQWLQQQGIPIIKGYAVEDLASLELGPWPRLGALGAAIQLVGMEGLTGVYVVEISPGETLAPEKHLFDELMYVVSGRGATQIWSGPGDGSTEGLHTFEWQTGSLFAPPLNTWHRLVNRSRNESARLIAVTSAPIVMDLFHDLNFVFNCDYQFTDRFDGRSDYFKVSEGREFFGSGWLWETNFIPDVRAVTLDAQEAKGHGAQVTWYQMSGSALVGHMGEWQAGQYNKAHHHAGGQIVLFLSSRGYTLLWPPEAGTQPYRRGNAQMVVRLDWREGSVLCPPTGWFHQHFNTGSGRARQLAMRYGSKRYGVGFKDVFDRAGVLVSVKQGGTQIEYEDEDPQIRSVYRRELEGSGVKHGTPGS
jgi:quercetin dioxygenase-like cupin family protein